ncbi:MAG: 50S ribosomal protein L25/general stress protein Ctc [Spirulinaceae cyanobacterium]
MPVTVECQKRAEGSKPRALRREGLIPATLYGHEGVESMMLTLKAKDAQNLLKEASLNNTLVDVKVPDLSWQGKALIREIQTHPWKRTLYHLSFFSVASQATIDVVIPINLVGEAVGQKAGGIVEQQMNELQLQCKPDSIPEDIEVDISDLEIGSTLLVQDLKVPEGVTVAAEPDTTVLTLVAPRSLTSLEEETATEEEVTDVISEAMGE